MQKILITGGSGLIGTRLTQVLIKAGFEVAHLGRSRKKGPVKTFIWNIESGELDGAAFENVTAVVHLAGANVGEKRWTKERKREILESRTRSTQLLYNYLKENKHSVSTLVSASAIGYYGFDDDDKIFHEEDGAGQGFLADVVKLWESEIDRISTLGIRVVKVRVGVVLSREDGALPEMARPVRFWVGAPLASGNQIISWIHVDDVVQVFSKAISDINMTGAINAVAPTPVTNRELTTVIAARLRKPLLMPPIPAFVIRALFGEMADVVIKGNNVSNSKLAGSGFEYRYPTLHEALQDLL